MPPHSKRSLIEAHKREIAGYLDEADEFDDEDLWEELVAKFNDALIVYRRAMRRQVIRFTDGRIGERVDVS